MRWRIARLVARKDLRIELRSRVVTNQVLPFAGIVMVMFAFALNTDLIVERVAPGLVWLATTTVAPVWTAERSTASSSSRPSASRPAWGSSSSHTSARRARRPLGGAPR